MAGGRPLTLCSTSRPFLLCCGAHLLPEHHVFPRATLRPSRGPTPSEKSSDLLDLPRTAGLPPSGADGGPVAPHSEGQVHDPSGGQLPDHSGREDHEEDPALPNDGVGTSSEAERETGEMTAARGGDDTSRGATRRVATLQMAIVSRSIDLSSSPFCVCARSHYFSLHASLCLLRLFSLPLTVSLCSLMCLCKSDWLRLVLQLRAPWSLHPDDDLVCGPSLLTSADTQGSTRNGRILHIASEDDATQGIHALAKHVGLIFLSIFSF